MNNQTTMASQAAGTAVHNDSPSFRSLMQDVEWNMETNGTWMKATPRGPVTLTHVSSSHVYGEFELRGGPLKRPSAVKHLAANASLAGPAKFVVLRGGRRPVCRIVLPPCAAEFVADPAREVDDPRQFVDFIQSWDNLLSPSATAPSAEIDHDACAAFLKSQGWTAEATGDQTLVHIQRRGLYGQIVLERCPLGGHYLGADLIELAGAPAAARRAARRVASVANRRLAMPRFSAVGEGESMKLRCEVHLGFGRVSNDWLLAATEAVEAGVVLTVRELQAAVRDTVLANLVVAAPAV